MRRFPARIAIRCTTGRRDGYSRETRRTLRAEAATIPTRRPRSLGSNAEADRPSHPITLPSSPRPRAALPATPFTARRGRPGRYRTDARPRRSPSRPRRSPPRAAIAPTHQLRARGTSASWVMAELTGLHSGPVSRIPDIGRSERGTRDLPRWRVTPWPASAEDRLWTLRVEPASTP